MEPHPDQDEQPEPRSSNRGGLIAAIVVGAIVLIFVVFHLVAALSLHGA
jgi:hypothetical protein